MFNVDTVRLIKKTFNRFFSLVMIVMIGVAFMMGLMSTPTIMRESVDVYNDNNNLQDVQIYSSYGFCLEDIMAIKQLDEVNHFYASKQMDVYCEKENGSVIVSRLLESDSSVNKYEIYEGRAPEKNNEALITVNMGSNKNYKLGDKVRFFLKNSEISDSLLNTEFTIVGFAKTPAYTSKVLGTSNLDNQDLSAIFYIPYQNFKADYYTTVFITLDGTEEKMSFTNSYDYSVEDGLLAIESLASKQQDYRKNILLDEYEEKIIDGENKLLEAKEKGQKELDDAKRKLDDANIQIVSSETNITLLNQVIKTANERIVSTEAILSDLRNDLNNDISETKNRTGIDFGENFDISKIIENFEDADTSLYEDAIRISTKRAEVESLQRVLNTAKDTLTEAQTSLKDTEKQLSSARYLYNKGLKEYSDGIIRFNEEIEKAEVELAKARQDLSELPDAKWTILDRTMHYSSYMYKSTIEQMGAIGYTLPILFFLVAALVCMTTMTRLIDEQRSQIGIFRALGFSKMQIISKYLFYAFSASMIGSVFGIFIGQAIFPTVIYNTWRLMYDLPPMKMSFPIHLVIICSLVFAVLMMGVTFIIVSNSLVEVPSQLMRPKAPKNAKKVFLENIKLIWENLSFTSKITARNLIRYKSRFFMTVIGIAGCTGLLVIGFGIKDSISDIINIQFGEIFNYDYQINLKDDHYIDDNIVILKDNYENETVVPFMTYTSKVYMDNKEDTINVQVYDPRDASSVLSLRKTDLKTELKLNNSGLIVSNKFAINNDIKKGDYITIESSNGIKASAKVEDICEMYFQHYIFISEAYYKQLFNENIHDTCIAIKTDNKNALIKDSEKLEDFSSIVDFSSMIEQFQTMIEALDFIILVIIVTAGSLALVVLINLTQVNISERIREIATLKVLGFNEQEVNMYIFKEILFLTIIGALIGLPLGIVEHHFIMNVINMEMVMFGMNISFMSFLYSFIITLVFTVLVLFMTKKQLREVEMVESLKSVE